MSLLYEGKGLRKYYGSHLAFALSEFELAKGASLVLTGPNGSGKSTFLRLLAFLEAPSCGELHYYGSVQPRRECTLLLQEAWLAHATVFNNVVLGLKLRGIRENLDERYRRAMTQSGFERPGEFARRRPGALSGGEKQRVALASRLILNPEVLLLDEPTAYVDARSAACIIAALRRAHDDGMTIICATHDRELAEALAAEKLELDARCHFASL